MVLCLSALRFDLWIYVADDEMDAPDTASMRQTDDEVIQLHRSVRYEN